MADSSGLVAVRSYDKGRVYIGKLGLFARVFVSPQTLGRKKEKRKKIDFFRIFLFFFFFQGLTLSGVIAMAALCAITTPGFLSVSSGRGGSWSKGTVVFLVVRFFFDNQNKIVALHTTP